MRYRKTAAALAVLTLGAAWACKESNTFTDPNSVSSSLISGGLNKSLVQLLVTGLANNDRGEFSETYIVFGETMGRDVFREDPAEPRFITQMVGAPADASAFTGSAFWTGDWTGVRTANTIIDDLRKTGAPDMTAGDTLATIGFAQTLKAISYFRVWQFRDTLGSPINVDTTIAQYLNQPPAFHCEATQLAYIVALLDSADTELKAAVAKGETAFPFTLPPGYGSNGTFNTPATFDAYFTQGFKGQAAMYLAIDGAGALPTYADTAIAAFNTAVAAGGALNNGVYFTYSTSSGDATSPFFADPVVYLNQQVCDSMQVGDSRISKTQVLATQAAKDGVTTSCAPASNFVTNATLPMPEMRVAELVLERAQAEIVKKSYAAALADINTVRTTEGGLAPIAAFVLSSAATPDSSAISNVLYEKRYSLLLNSADRMSDLRAYSRLATPWHKKELASDIFQTTLPIPVAEVNARASFTNVAPVSKAPACP